jgi:hypothetical protein
VDGDSGPIEKVEPEIVVNEKTISDLCPWLTIYPSFCHVWEFLNTSW